MMHLMPSLEEEDPRLTSIYMDMRPTNSPKYGLGYIEQADKLIPDCRFRDLPPGCSFIL